MEKINDGGPAFPTMMKIGEVAKSEGGMSLRDYFAAKSMHGMTSDKDRSISIANEAERQGHSYSTEVAIQSFDMADAMLKERNK